MMTMTILIARIAAAVLIWALVATNAVQAAVAIPSSTSATSSDASGGASVSVSVSPPSGLTTDDVWVIVVVLDADAGGGTINVPSGFAAVHAQISGNGSGYPHVRAFWKAAGASESAVSVSGSTGVYILWAASVRVTGADSASPIGNVTSTNPAGNGTTLSVPGITVQHDGSGVLLVAAASSLQQINAETLLTNPSGSTTLQSREGNHTWPTGEVAYVLRDAGSYSPSDWAISQNAEGRIAVTIEIKPDSGESGGGGIVCNPISGRCGPAAAPVTQ